MAKKRMFSLQIVDTDAFLDMPHSSQLLYFHLSMRADDDGFVSNPKKMMRMIGSQEDDYKVLLAKRFIIPFESGVCVIKHWRINNYIRSDRYTETAYTEEKKSLHLKENGAYTDDVKQLGIPNDNQTDTKGVPSIDKVRLDKNREKGKKARFLPPSLEEIKEQIKEKKYTQVNAESFYNFYQANGWMVGKNKMKDWKAALAGWESRSSSNKQGTPSWYSTD